MQFSKVLYDFFASRLAVDIWADKPSNTVLEGGFIGDELILSSKAILDSLELTPSNRQICCNICQENPGIWCLESPRHWEDRLVTSQ